jgi:hypothetical protein
MNMDQSQRNNVNMDATSDGPTQPGQGQIQAEIQFRAYFVTAVESQCPDGYKLSRAARASHGS